MANIKKTLLKRELSINLDISKDYINSQTKGNLAFSSTSSSSFSSLSDSLSSPSSQAVGEESIYQSGLNEFIFDSLTLKGTRFPESFNFEIEECMDNLYRKGLITFVTPKGLIEHCNIINTFEGEKFSITLKNKFEKSDGRVISFGLYDMQTDPVNQITSYSLYEEPFFTNLHKESLSNSYKGVTAMQIIASIMSKTVKTEGIKMIYDSNDPKFSSFIIPNWSPNKTIKYLSQYSKKGPIKTFNISLGQKTVTVIGSLHQFMTDKVYPSNLNNFKIIPSISQNTKDAIKLGPFKILGTNHTDTINNLSGETVITFNHLGDPQPDWSTFDNNINYDFTSKYKNKKTYASTVSGSYKDGIKLAKSDLGNESFHKIQTKSNRKQRISIDADENSLTQAKLISRFFQSYHDEVMLYTILPGISTVNVGQLFDIILPSDDQQRSMTATPVKDESLSGKWLLWKIVHKVVMMETRPKYEMHCYFLRTGYNKSTQYRNADRMI